MDHGKDHHSSHNVATQLGKKSYDSADLKQHQAEENQAPRSGFQLGETATGYAPSKASELSTFGTKDFEDLESESRSNSEHDSEEHAEHSHEEDKDHHHTKK